MADIEQSLQEIQQERSRLLTAKENLKTAITGKGVTVADDAKLDAYYTFVNSIQVGVEGGIDVSATTATEADVLSTAKFYKADGSFVSGTIQTVSPTLNGNNFTIKKGYVAETETLTIPAVTPTLNANTVTIPIGYIETEQTLTVPAMADVTISANTVTIPVGYNATSKTVSIPKATPTLNANTVTIPAGYHDQNTLTVAESVITETETKVTIGVGYVGTAKEYVLNNGSGESVDLSFVTAGADQILSGYVGSDKDGNPVNGSIQPSHAGVGYNEDNTFFVFAVTPGYRQDDYEFSIPVMKPTVNKNIVTIDAGIYDPTEIVIPEAEEPTVNGNTVTIHPGYVTEETTVQTEGGTASNVAGVLVDDNGVLKVQKLNFDGTTPSDGDIVEADKFYLFNTGKDEPEYGDGTSTSGSMEIYKCVDADGMTWWVVSSCGSEDANGRYYQSDKIWSDYMMTWTYEYYQKDGNCTMVYAEGYWQLKSAGTKLYHDESYNYYNGDPSQCTGWVVDSGVTPVPTIAKETTTGNGWRGKKYDTKTGEVAEEVTELEYKYKVPTIGKFYTADGTIECDVFGQSGLVFSKTFNSESMECLTGQKLSLFAGTQTVTTYKGVPCWLFDGTTAFSFDDSKLPNQNKDRSVSFFVNHIEFVNGEVICGYGTISSKQRFAVASTNSSIIVYTFGNTSSITTSIVSDKWYHITICYSMYNVSFYVNGEWIGDSAFPAQGINTVLLKGVIGCNNSDSPNIFTHSYIANVKVYNRVLRQDEIKAEADRCLAMVTE